MKPISEVVEELYLPISQLLLNAGVSRLVDKDLKDWLTTTLEARDKAEREDEREKFCIILKKLYQAGDSRKEMTMEYFQKIKDLTNPKSQ